MFGYGRDVYVASDCLISSCCCCSTTMDTKVMMMRKRTSVIYFVLLLLQVSVVDSRLRMLFPIIMVREVRLSVF